MSDEDGRYSSGKCCICRQRDCSKHTRAARKEWRKQRHKARKKGLSDLLRPIVVEEIKKLLQELLPEGKKEKQNGN